MATRFCSAGGTQPEHGAPYRSMSVEEAVAHAEVVVLAVPFGALATVLPPLGSLLIRMWKLGATTDNARFIRERARALTPEK